MIKQETPAPTHRRSARGLTGYVAAAIGWAAMSGLLGVAVIALKLALH